MSEANLITIARAIVSLEPDIGVHMALSAHASLEKISPYAMEVLKDTLAKGSVHILAHLGGASAIVRSDLGTTKLSRVYEVRPTPKIVFSNYTFSLLQWLTNTPLNHATVAPFTAKPRTVGDQLAAYLVMRLVIGTQYESVVAEQSGLACPLVWLGFARALARQNSEAITPEFKDLLSTRTGRIVTECLAKDLALRWAASTSWPPRDTLDAELATRVGVLEESTLTAFIDASAKLERWDLVTFIIDAALAALPEGEKPEQVARRTVPPTIAGGTLRARTAARQKAGALFRVIARLSLKFEELAAVRFIDEGYEIAQATLESWNRLGRPGFVRAAAVVHELNSLNTFTAESSRPLP